MAGRVIAQLLIMGGSIMARAFVQAYQQALANSGRSGGAAAAARNIRGRITAEQASQILGVEKNAGLKDIYKKYDHLFKQNDPTKGGSIYLQAKIHNAKTELEKVAIARGEQPPPSSSQQPSQEKSSQNSSSTS